MSELKRAFADAVMLALKMQEGAMSQGMQAAVRRWKKQENVFSPRWKAAPAYT